MEIKGGWLEFTDSIKGCANGKPEATCSTAFVVSYVENSRKLDIRLAAMGLLT